MAFKKFERNKLKTEKYFEKKIAKIRLKKAIFPHEGKNIILIMFSFNNVTKSQLNDLMVFMKIRRSSIPAELAKRLFSDPELQSKFSAYSKTYKEIKGEDITKTGLHEQLGFPEDVLDSIEIQKFSFNFSDRSKFVRALISFFHDEYYFPKEKLQEDIDKISTKLMEMGYVIVKTSVIEGKMHFLIEKPL